MWRSLAIAGATVGSDPHYVSTTLNPFRHRPVTAPLLLATSMLFLVAPGVFGEQSLTGVPNVVEIAPDFALQQRGGGPVVRLSTLRGQDVALVFSSATCPVFASQVNGLIALATRYSQVRFYMVYVREAHPSDGAKAPEIPGIPPSKVTLPMAKGLGEKAAHADKCAREFALPFPILVDGMDNAVELAYSGWPYRLYLIDKAGRVRFGKAGFPVLAEFEGALRRLQ